MTSPSCKYFGVCGGCTAQHIDYGLQVENKRKRLAKSIGFEQVRAFFGDGYNYRNRMDFIFFSQGIGFRQRSRPDRFVDVERCVISDEALNRLLYEVRAYFRDADAFDTKSRVGTFRYAVIRCAEAGSSISFVLNKDSTRLSQAVEMVRDFSGKATADNVVVALVDKGSDVSTSDDFFAVKGQDMLEDIYLGKHFLFSTQGFFQNNHGMAERMYGHCRDILSGHDTKQASLLDLYGGVGCIGIICADLFRDVLIIENVAASIKAAQINIEKNSVDNAEAMLLDAKQLKKASLRKPLYVVTDPPRSGMDEKTIMELKRLEPEVIVYVSCNITQLGKDLKKFKDYTIRSAALFDLFPQTLHCEAVVELVRRQKPGSK